MQLANLSNHDSHTHASGILSTPSVYKSPRVGIPTFPNFKKLGIIDKQEIESYSINHKPYSDFNFISLWSYDTTDSAEVCYLNSNLVIKYFDYLTNEPFFTFLGTNSVVETVSILLNWSMRLGISPVLKLIPENTIQALSSVIHPFYLEEDIDNHDYIFSIAEHAELKGRKYREKRQLANQFRKNTNNYSIKILDIKSKKYHIDLIELFNIWEKNKNMQKDSFAHEHIAINRLLRSSGEFNNLHALAIFVGDKMVGFSISNLVHDNYVIGHFEKLDMAHIGLSAFLKQEVAKYFKLLGCEYINYEQDLGIYSLRRAKQLWNPINFFKKYKLYYSK